MAQEFECACILLIRWVYFNWRFKKMKFYEQLATIMSDQGFWYFVLNHKQSSETLVDGHLGGLYEQQSKQN